MFRKISFDPCGGRAVFRNHDSLYFKKTIFQRIYFMTVNFALLRISSNKVYSKIGFDKIHVYIFDYYIA